MMRRWQILGKDNFFSHFVGFCTIFVLISLVRFNNIWLITIFIVLVLFIFVFKKNDWLNLTEWTMTDNDWLNSNTDWAGGVWHTLTFPTVQVQLQNYKLDNDSEWLKWLARLSVCRLIPTNASVDIMEPTKHTSKVSTVTLKPRPDVTRSQKQGYQWPHRKDIYMSSKFEKIKVYQQRLRHYKCFRSPWVCEIFNIQSCTSVYQKLWQSIRLLFLKRYSEMNTMGLILILSLNICLSAWF